MNYTTNGKWRKTVQISDSLPNGRDSCNSISNKVALGSILRYKYVLLDDRKPNGGVPQWEPGAQFCSSSTAHHLIIIGAQPREIKIEDNTRDIVRIDRWGVSRCALF